jgi:hypothetical protein
MGDIALCTLHLDGRSDSGKALLEQHDLIFRGPVRLAIPLKNIRSAVAEDGKLTVEFGQQTAVFDLGVRAAKWAQRIVSPPSRLDKLGVRPGMSVLISGAIDADLVDEVTARGARLLAAPRPRAADVVFHGANRRAALGRLRTLRSALKPAGALWIIRPKGTAAITEAEVMAAGKNAGLVDVKVVSFSPTHTAEKFVIPLSAR